VAYLVSTRIKNKHIKSEPYYKYFRIGLFVKLFAGLAFAGIYLLYYYGGDTTVYFLGSGSVVKMASHHFPTFLKLLAGEHSPEVYSMFNNETGWPTYFRDPNSFAVCRFNVPFYMLSFGSYIGNTLIIDAFLYAGIWRFYRMLIHIYPEQERHFAYALLFFPSVVFWGSGILKDGWTFVAILIILTTIYQIFIKRKSIGYNIILLIIWSYIAIQIRPYIFYSALGTGLIWLGFSYIKTVKNRFLRTFSLPIVFVLLYLAGTLIFARVSSIAGNRFSSIDAMLEQAQIIQNDLSRDVYGENSFDIGDFEATIPGILSKAPKATVAGLFRPFIWEARSFLMLISGMENLFLLLFSIYILFSMRLRVFFQRILSDPFIVASIIFALTYAFMVGLTTANFGAMVRYRIPSLPFYLIFLFLMRNPVVKKEQPI
jgi:hypothetical protein